MLRLIGPESSDLTPEFKIFDCFLLWINNKTKRNLTAVTQEKCLVFWVWPVYVANLADGGNARGIEMQRAWCYRAMVPIPPNGPSRPLFPFAISFDPLFSLYSHSPATFLTTLWTRTFILFYVFFPLFSSTVVCAPLVCFTLRRSAVTHHHVLASLSPCLGSTQPK